MFLTPHHHRTYFPFLLVAMTLALAGLILLTFGGRFRSTDPTELSDPVTAIEYQADARAVLKGLTSALAVAASDAERVEILQEKQTELLELIVPAEFQTLHLDLVITLSKWAAAYKESESQESRVVESQVRWDEIVTANPWIE